MRGNSIAPPSISRTTLNLFTAYSRWFLHRNFHAFRIARVSRPSVNGPAIVCLNHASWWDPLVALVLAKELFPDRAHYAPMDAAQLERYRIFGQIGMFGVAPGTAIGASRFLSIGEQILSSGSSMLWVTAQGRFADPRERPVVLRSGVAHLIRRVPRVPVIPLAIEYPFWMERYPEILVRFGESLAFEAAGTANANEQIAKALETTQNSLAVSSLARDAGDFDVLLGGRTGIGGVYDLWRRAMARFRGESFQTSHELGDNP